MTKLAGITELVPGFWLIWLVETLARLSSVDPIGLRQEYTTRYSQHKTLTILPTQRGIPVEQC